MKPDLHMHSTMSDGVRTPEELYAYCESLGLSHMSLTDHDTYAGLDHLDRMNGHVQTIPGVELSLKPMRSFHLLVYGDGRGTPMHDRILTLAEARRGRAQSMLEKLHALGCRFSDDWYAWFEDMQKHPTRSVGRMHLARALVEAQYVRSVGEAFDRYLSEGRPAYVPQQRMTMQEALEIALGCGLVPVLAHPRELGIADEILEDLVRTWTDQGLMGMEVYHPSAGRKGFESLENMARRYKLLVTGGSDYHDTYDETHGIPGAMASVWKHCEEDLGKLLEKLK